MPHAKFQSPIINIDRDFQLFSRVSKGERKKGSKWRDQDVKLRICPKGKGGAKNTFVFNVNLCKIYKNWTNQIRYLNESLPNIILNIYKRNPMFISSVYGKRFISCDIKSVDIPRFQWFTIHFLWELSRIFLIVFL